MLILETVIKMIGYSMMIFGLWLCCQPMVKPLLDEGLMSYRRKRRLRRYTEQVEKVEQKTKLYRHLEILLKSVRKDFTHQSVSHFIFLSITLLCTSTTILTFLLKDIVLALLLGCIIGSVPYTSMRIRLTGIRTRNSVLFLQCFHIVLSNYQSTGRDIYFTIVNTIKQIREPHLKQAFIKLVNAMQMQKNTEEFNAAIQVFIYSTESHFAKRFGKLLLRAHISRIDIFQALIQLDQDIRKRKVDMEEEKTKNQDTIWQGYFPLVTLPLSVLFSYQMAGVLDYWYFFSLKLNLTIFLLCLILSGLSILIAHALRKPSPDI